MEEWQELLRFDPLPQLLSSRNGAIVFFASRDLLNATEDPVETLWKLPQAIKMLKRQREDGAWKYPGGDLNIRSRANYNQLETYRILGELVEKYGFNNNHPAVRKAAVFLFRFQTDEGDFRGIYGNQYTPNYTAGIMELLIKAGHENDPRIEKGFQWLLAIRQQDGGWAIPIRTRNLKLDIITMDTETVQPEPSRPFSHLVTGVVLRAFAAHKTTAGQMKRKPQEGCWLHVSSSGTRTLTEAHLSTGLDSAIHSGSRTCFPHSILYRSWGSPYTSLKSRPQYSGLLKNNRKMAYGTCTC